ncbi:MAG TPA: tRNA (adenosine(37)-N6)-threonylcarbamoyltransferase complex ATPase subunit type 1 TsaE [Actinomycetota bacterium]|nr:tRNA (adenosine(37)-N6)-threonylcarbamoyltransferase complex ATPase subunit type 1 TsaE [Actinomycetota bacterium]
MRLPYLTVRTRSADETRSLGHELGQLVLPGEVLLLTGGLGTGKTTFIQGLARGLGVDTRATSPSFTLMRVYEGRYPLLHVDLYRCDTLHEIADLGLEQMMEPPWVSVFEWGEKAGPLIPTDHLEVEFAWDQTDDDTRVLQFRPMGQWQDRMRELSDRLRAAASAEGAG